MEYNIHMELAKEELMVKQFLRGDKDNFARWYWLSISRAFTAPSRNFPSSSSVHKVPD